MPPMDVDGDIATAAPAVSRDRVRENRVTFGELEQPWAYAYAGIEVVRFKSGEIADVSDTCLACMDKLKIPYKKTPNEKETWEGAKTRLEQQRKEARERSARRNL